ncbi:MAG: Bug family tripartite tricarboxylate transporter substrate binding protein [Beijerinckiaceae bacterium]
MRLLLSAMALFVSHAWCEATAQSASQAQAYPVRAVRLVVPFPAGGPTDVLARVLGQHMSEKWGQSVVIENRPGAGSAVAAAAVARSEADGYTLLMAMDTTLVMNPLAMKSINYKADDFAPISLAASNTSILVVPASGPKTVEELIARGRAEPGKMNYGAGIITTRLGAFLFSRLSGIKAVSVPYNGSAEVVRALLDGSIDYAIDGIAPHLPHIRDGKIRALAKLDSKPIESLPDLKPLDQIARMPELADISTWVGVVAPAGVSRNVIDTVREAVVQATNSAEIRRKMAPLGITVTNSTPEEFAALIKSESRRWEPVVKESGFAN